MASILIVEDEGVVAIEIMGRLLDMGHRVVGIAKSGESALRKVHEGKPEIILMDVKLHGQMSGIDVAAIINERYGIPVIYITAHTDSDTMIRMNGTRHSGVLHKPVEASEIRDAIESALKARTANPARSA